MPVVKKLNSSNEESAYGRLRILIADDHSMSADLEADSLRRGGFLISTAKTIDEMKYVLSRERMDVVLMDYNFVKGRGLSEIRHAKSKSRNTKVKFLVTSVQNHDSLRVRAFECHCDLFLVKPIPRPTLIEEIKKLAKQDYRKSVRVKCNIPFIVIVEKNVHETIANDISSDGAHLLDKENKINPYVGLEISLEFILPKTSDLIKTRAVVVRITEEGFGLKFQNISENDKIKIKNFILTSGLNVKSVDYYL